MEGEGEILEGEGEGLVEGEGEGVTWVQHDVWTHPETAENFPVAAMMVTVCVLFWLLVRLLLFPLQAFASLAKKV